MRSSLEYLPLLGLLGIIGTCFYWFGPLRTSLGLIAISGLFVLGFILLRKR